MPLPELATLAGLFLTALVAATVFPGQSEALLVALLLAGGPPVPLVLAASTGNIAGSIVNWLLGRGLARFENRRWFPLKPAALARATRWYERFGKWSLLLSWAPIIGDPLTLVAGVLRERFATFLSLVTLAKTGRYVVVAALTLPHL